MKYLTRAMSSNDEARHARATQLRNESRSAPSSPGDRERREAKNAALVSRRAAHELVDRYRGFVRDLKSAGVSADDSMVRRWEARLAGAQDAIKERGW